MKDFIYTYPVKVYFGDKLPLRRCPKSWRMWAGRLCWLMAAVR